MGEGTGGGPGVLFICALISVTIYHCEVGNRQPFGMRPARLLLEILMLCGAFGVINYGMFSTPEGAYH